MAGYRSNAPIPKGTKIATKADFRNQKGLMKQDFMYYQLHLGFNRWDVEFTSKETNQDDLRTRILLGSIAVLDEDNLVEGVEKI